MGPENGPLFARQRSEKENTRLIPRPEALTTALSVFKYVFGSHVEVSRVSPAPVELPTYRVHTRSLSLSTLDTQNAAFLHPTLYPHT